MGNPATDRLSRAVIPHEIVDGRKVVTADTDAEAISDTSLEVDFIIITAETDNTGVIVVGASTVVALAGTTRRGVPLNAGDSVSLGAVDLAKVYLDATVAGDGVTYLYLI